MDEEPTIPAKTVKQAVVSSPAPAPLPPPPSGPLAKCGVCGDKGGAFIWQEVAPPKDENGAPLKDEKGEPLKPTLASVPCCDARAPQSLPHEAWAEAKGVELMWMKAARAGRGWPLGYEVTEEQFDAAVHHAKHGVIR